MNILLFQKVVPSFRVPIFKVLYEKYKILVCHSLERKQSTWQSAYSFMDFPNILLKRFYYMNRDTTVVQNILPVIIKYKPKIIISEFSLRYMTFWLLFILKPVFKYKLAIWTHGVDNQDMMNPFNTKKSRLALFIYKSVDGILLYSYERKRIIEENIGNDKKLFVAVNTLDTKLLNQLYVKNQKIGISEIKTKLGFKEQFNIIYTGRLLKTKRIDLLLSSFELLMRSFNVGLHIIGDGPEINLIKQYQSKIKSIYSYGAIYDEELLGQYIYASDVTVIPGYVGLSIVHSFAYGNPLITCKMTIDGPFHSPEIEYLHHGKNGLLCDSTAESIAENISYLLDNEDVLKVMSQSALDTVENECSVDNMIEGFENMLSYLHSS